MARHEPRTGAAEEAVTLDGRAASFEATVVRTVYANEENGFSVVRLTGDTTGAVTATGPLLGLREGDRLRVSGRWVEHPRFGRQLEVSSFVQLLPSSLDGIRRFLASRRIRGIGPKTAERLVAAFGLDTLDVLDHHPERLVEVRGIGRPTAQRIATSWQHQRGHREVLLFLASHGVTAGVAMKVARRYGAAALEVVRSNPYRLSEEVVGIGFLTADRIARGLGVPADAPERLEAGLLHSLARAAEEGHTALREPRLLESARRVLETDADLSSALGRIVERGLVVRRADADGTTLIATAALDRAEGGVARSLRRLLEAEPSIPIDVRRALAWHRDVSGLALEPQQRTAVELALTGQVVVVTGGPGTGKTTLVRALVEILNRRGDTIELAAPTGRAAKRLAEATGRPARTIHRLLEFNPSSASFARSGDDPLDADLLVIDEASMLDVELADCLLDAVPDGCRLVLVGDADQLPSVGPGNVLGDIIACGQVATVRLDHVFRQAEASRIVVNAHRINHGQMPLLDRDPESGDFFFVARDDPEAAADTVVDLVVNRIPGRFGLHPVRDIQVLTPMHRGPLGVAALNHRLQELLAPPGPELAVGARHFRQGDKVMQVRNNYELDIFNGDIGRVEAADGEQRELIVSFDDRPVRIAGDNLDDLVPAYACTVHKSQGSEYPAVVLALHRQHHVMLERNLLYTAVTRARRLVVVVGSRAAVWRAVTTASVRARCTTLADRLRTSDPQP
jgi:exodeoxyribonuclease V alpha subunit